MLVEIYCPEFKENGKVRPPVRFHEGLNVVAGTDVGGKNSIGKSTFLMIVDFVFGGRDYVDKCKDVQEAIGAHTIFFTFCFGGKSHRFARSSSSYKDVYRCDDNYNPTEKMSLEDYCKFLLEQYGMEDLGMTFRSAVSSFFRIYHRESLDRNHPLQDARRASDEKEYDRIYKLMGRYGFIESATKALNDANERWKTFKNASDLGYFLRTRTKKDYKENEVRIADLKQKLAELTAQAENGHADMDSVVATQVRTLRNEIAKHRRLIAESENVLAAMRRDQSATSRKFAKDFGELTKFFPSANIAKLEEVETFHEKLQVVLNEEFKNQEQDLINNINMSQARIAELDIAIDKLSKETNLTKAILDQYSQIDSEIKSLEDSNRMYDEDLQFVADIKDYKETLEDQKTTQTHDIEKVVNKELERLNDIVCKGEKTAPFISLSTRSKLELRVEKDQGTGAEDRGLILFDIAMLNLTKIPAIAHDSFLVSNIEDNQVVELVKLYAMQKKQVFLAFEKAMRYGTETAQLIETNTVLALHKNGGELFGRSWSQKAVAKDN